MARSLFSAGFKVLLALVAGGFLLYELKAVFIGKPTVSGRMKESVLNSATLEQLQQQYQDLVRRVQQLEQRQPPQQDQQPQPQFQPQDHQQQKILLHSAVNLVSSSPPENSPPAENCVPLPRSPAPATICTHSQTDDRWVSGEILKGQLWEGDLVLHMVQVLKENPNMELVDIGANIGIYTLAAASLGRHVVAVDMLDTNILLVQNSLAKSKFSHLVSLVQNALYRDRSLKLGVKTYAGNIGGSYVDENPTNTSTVQSVCLDDLLPLVKSKTVFMKMDIENSEHHALACGQNFFSEIDVKILQMEWSNKKADAIQEIQNFVTKFHYSVKKLSGGRLIPLTGDLSTTGRGDLFFVKEGAVR